MQFYGIVFPIVIMLVVPARQYLMPRVFRLEHLRELDMAEYEEAPPIEHDEALMVTPFLTKSCPDTLCSS